MPHKSTTYLQQESTCIWIFGYSSLLLSIWKERHRLSDESTVACKLIGWRRTWSAVRTEQVGARKRFVDALALEPVSKYAFSSAVRSEKDFINGIAFRVSREELIEYDFREQGYDRVDVTKEVITYDGSEISGIIYVYIDAVQNGSIAPVSYDYINMGIFGAAKWDQKINGFLRDFCLSTPVPPGGLSSFYFVYVGQDGQTIWLLHLDSELKTLLALLPNKIFSGNTLPPESTADWQTPCPKNWQSYDYRYHFDDAISAPENEMSILCALQDAIWGENPEHYINHKNWLVRLGCLSGPAINMDWARQLLNDPDDWVSRSASAVLGLPMRGQQEHNEVISKV